MSNKFVEIAIPVAVRRTLLYSVPQRLQDRIARGVRVLVPLGKRKLLVGYVVELKEETEIPADKIKDLIDVLDTEALLSPQILELTRRVADYYFAPWGMVLKNALPSGINMTSVTEVGITAAGLALYEGSAAPNPREKAPARFKILRHLFKRKVASVKDLSKWLQIKSINTTLNELESEGAVVITQRISEPRIKQKRRLVVRLAEAEAGANGLHLTEKQGKVLSELKRADGFMALADLLKAAGCTSAIVRSLKKKGLLGLSWEVVLRSPEIGEGTIAAKKEHELTAEQQRVLAEILRGIEQGDARMFLVHGVTGSGKTEIYMRAIREVLRRGGSALMLVPEIALTPAVSQLFQATFGDCVAILHSGLSEGERLDEWWRIRRGEARVVVGTRSAIFAPLRNLRLIIVDEEQDSSYKQEDTPHYHAREAARLRAGVEGAVVVLGSATPSLETFYEAKKNESITYLALESRILDRPLAEVTIVDMREEFLHFGRASVVSETLRQAIARRLERKEQVLILLNRRGYSNFVLCRACGNTLYCDHCSISMTFHRAESRLVCHYCGDVKPIPEKCLQCGKPYVYYVGEGTEKIEEIMKEFFPQASIGRMDYDTTRKKGSYHDILAKLAQGKTDMLIGTQMIAKGHDFPRVTLVGVVAADTGLSFPDFRAAERTFQLLTQVAGRAGRGDIAGEVVIQTYYPNHYSLKFACQQNYYDFYSQEIKFRQLMHYPPFTHIANVLIRDKSLEKIKRIGEKVAAEMRALRAEVPGGEAVKILGPAPAPLEKIKGEYRYQILIKSTDKAILHRVLEKSYDNLFKARAGMKSVSLDIDPMTIM